MLVECKGYTPDSFKVKENVRNAKVTIASGVIKWDFLEEYKFEEIFLPLTFIDIMDNILVVSVPPTVEAIDVLERLLAVIETREIEWYKSIDDINTMLMEVVDDFNKPVEFHDDECNGCECTGGSTNDE